MTIPGPIAPLRYPFPVAAQQDSDVAALTAEMMDVASSYQLFRTAEKTAQGVHWVVAFATYCSPAGAALAELRICGRLLLACLVLNDFNDGSPHPDFPQLVRRLWAILNGLVRTQECVHPGAEALVEDLRRALLERSAAIGSSLASLLHFQKLSWSSFLWEWEVKGKSVPLSAYSEHRVHTICTLPYLELWKLLMPLRVEEVSPVSSRLAELERLAAEVQFLANDLCSLKQDVRKDKQNIVPLLRAEEDLSLEDAIAKVREMHDRKVEQMVARGSELRDASPPPALGCYLHFLESQVAGNAWAMQDLRHRYEPPGGSRP
jgi:hypothetical protein